MRDVGSDVPYNFPAYFDEFEENLAFCGKIQAFCGKIQYDYNEVPQSPIGICWYMQVYTGIYWYIPACTVLSDTDLSVSGYNMVQGGTMKYPKVLLVHAGTCWYILVFTGIHQHVLCFQMKAWTFL